MVINILQQSAICCKSVINIFLFFLLFSMCNYAVNWCDKLFFCGRIWLTLFNCTIVAQASRWYFPHFVSNFVAMATRAVVVEFVWHHSIDRPWKPHVGRKDLRDISYTSRFIDDYISNFVAIATWVGLVKICLTSLDSPTPKTPCWTQRSPRYIVYKLTYSRFCPKFRCHRNRGWSQ